MPAQRVIKALGVAALFAAAACSGQDQTPTKPLPDAGSGGSGGAGGGAAGSGGGAAGTGGAPVVTCGNGVIDPGEACDGQDFGGKSCADFGAPAGALSCTGACKIDVSKCASVEDCTDGLDNDKNGKTDCFDPACAAACGDACASAVTLKDFVTIHGTTTGHANKLNATCSSPMGSGPELVYKVTASQTGVLDLALTADSANLGLSARTACASPGSEIGCADHTAGPDAVERLKVPVTANEVVFIVVQGFAKADAGSFTLEVKTRPVVCGDGYIDGSEACDDGNIANGDGCSALCQLETTEVEPNDTAMQANAYASPWYAAIDAPGDADVVLVQVPNGGATLSAAVSDFDGKSCAYGLLDSFLQILGPDGNTVIAAADSGGVGTCSATSASNLVAGAYYVRVIASPVAPAPTFAYKLSVTVQ